MNQCIISTPIILNIDCLAMVCVAKLLCSSYLKIYNIFFCHRNQNTSLRLKTIPLPMTFKWPVFALNIHETNRFLDPTDEGNHDIMRDLSSSVWLVSLNFKASGCTHVVWHKVAFRAAQNSTTMSAAFPPDPLTGGLRLTGPSPLSCSEHQTTAFPLVSWFMGCLGVVHRHGIVGTHNYDVCIFPKRLRFIFHPVTVASGWKHHPASGWQSFWLF